MKQRQVEALQAKVEALSKKIASLLQLLPGLGERFGVSMQQMSDHVFFPVQLALHFLHSHISFIIPSFSDPHPLQLSAASQQ